MRQIPWRFLVLQYLLVVFVSFYKNMSGINNLKITIDAAGQNQLTMVIKRGKYQ